jgi:hypothetical protein
MQVGNVLSPCICIWVDLDRERWTARPLRVPFLLECSSDGERFVYPEFDSIPAAMIYHTYRVVEAAARFGFRTSQVIGVKLIFVK